ncbi:MAG: glycosyltransferase family 39 protein [Candidatus Omnitrophica bacterium]|nr:glycosyltransferase family 39 protein [Candidatus Omnitrophota bacterium]
MLRLLFRRNWPFKFPEALALSYGIGIAAVSIQMAIMPLCGMRFSVFSLMIWWVPLIAVTLLIGFKNPLSLRGLRAKRSRTKQSKKEIASSFDKSSGRSPEQSRGASLTKRFARNDNAPLTLIERFFVLGISFEVLYAFFRTLIKPMESYDSIAIYALKSKIFYLDKMIPLNFFKSFANFVPHIEYPLLIPLAETQFYTFLGSLNDLLVKIIFPLYYAALLTIAYSVSGRFLNRKAALFFTFLLATIPQVTDFATNGYADIPFAFYCSVSFFYLYLWLKQNENPHLALSFIFSIFAVWTKPEGLLFALIYAAVIITCMAKERRLRLIGVTYAVMSLCVVITYVLGWRAIGLAVNSDFTGTQVSLASKIITGFRRIPAILYEYQIQFFGPKKWNMIWMLFIAGFILGFKKIFSKEIFPVTLAILLVFSGYSIVYMLSSAPQGFGWHLSTSGSRLFLHFVPMVVLWLALIFKELKLEI